MDVILDTSENLRKDTKTMSDHLKNQIKENLIKNITKDTEDTKYPPLIVNQ